MGIQALTWNRMRLPTACVFLAASLGFAAYDISARQGVFDRPWEDVVVEWEDFSLDRLQDAREEGKLVIVSYMAEWDIASVRLHYQFWDNDEAMQFLHGHQAVLLKADCTEGPVEGFDATMPLPSLQVYPPGCDGPHVVLEPGGFDGIKAALKRAAKP